MSDATATAGSSVPEPVRGPWDAVAATPELRAGSIRRSTSIDMRRPGGFEGPLTAELRGRDLHRTATGEERVLDEVRVVAEIEEWSGRLLAVTGHDHPGLEALVGVSIRRGYGRALVGSFAEDLERRTLLASILEDLGGALLVSGYAPLRRGLLVASPEEGAARAEMQQDICAGWAVGGPLVEKLRSTGTNAVPYGPEAPPVTRTGWHETVPPEVETVTRIRSLDVGPIPDGGPDATVAVRAHFRDAYESDDGPMIMHEYLVRAEVGGTGPTIEAIAVEPRVLPWSSCPSAAASGGRVVGIAVGELPARIRAELVGPPTCTHLNSTLRSLADVGPLLQELGR